MNKKFKIDGLDYNLDDLSDKGHKILKQLSFINEKLQSLNSQKALLNRARNGYIQDIKIEIIEKKSGVDLDGLFLGD